MNSRGLFLLAALAAFATSGCAINGSSTDAPATPSQPFLIVVPEDLRLVAASNAISSRIGHEISYDIDPVILKDTTNLQELVSTALETVARGIDEARAYAPEATGRTCLTWTNLKIELDEKTREPYARFDDRTGTLVLRVPTRATSFATERGVALALAPPT